MPLFSKKTAPASVKPLTAKNGATPSTGSKVASKEKNLFSNGKKKPPTKAKKNPINFMTTEKYQLYPDGNFYTIPELESKIKFKYLPSITFETLEMKEAIRNRGLAKLKNKEVTPKSQKLGKKLTPLIESSYI